MTIVVLRLRMECDLDSCCVYKSMNNQVDFNSSKDELSTKKIRRKAEKAMKKEVDTLTTRHSLSVLLLTLWVSLSTKLQSLIFQCCY